jgi:hypothetical protein
MTRFSMRCVDCGLLLSEAEETAGSQCSGCAPPAPQMVGPLCEAGRFARCAHPSCDRIVRDWCRAIISRLHYRPA